MYIPQGTLSAHAQTSILKQLGPELETTREYNLLTPISHKLLWWYYACQKYIFQILSFHVEKAQHPWEIKVKLQANKVAIYLQNIHSTI